MSELKNHKDLTVWQTSIDFVTDIYKTTKSFPKEELNGLTNQIRRASVSIPSNIAEGAARRSKNEFRQFLYISLGSLAEVETQLIISLNLKYITSEEFNHLNTVIISIRKMLLGLIKSINY
ncbi:MAG: four helix bundle protein [Melioribacteraceae bacterium]|nr:four helix bundle protein [Melioribacteraceae bacterium]